MLLSLLLLMVVGCTTAEKLWNTLKAAETSPSTWVFTDAAQTPPEVTFKEFPIFKVYPIRTRIIIEGTTVPLFTGEDPRVWWSRSFEQIEKELRYTEKIYKNLIKFSVQEVVYREYEPNVDIHFYNAFLHSDALTITYMLPNTFPYAGYSTGPWQANERGIFINYYADEFTLPHEVGHYFGLLHPFMHGGDYVDDTPEQQTTHCSGEINSVQNCRNMMSYCDHTPKFVTSGQMDRLRRFLRDKRRNHVVMDKPSLKAP